MKLNTKLSIIILEVALIPLLVMGFVTYSNAEKQLTQKTINELDAIAEIQQDRLTAAVAESTARLNLFATKLQLRQDIASYNQGPTPALQAQIVSNIEEAKLSSDTIRGIIIVSPQGKLIAATKGLSPNKNLSQEPYLKHAFEKNDVSYLERQSDGTVLQYLVGPLRLQGKVIGAVAILEDPKNIFALAQDYTGLGQTGETLIAKDDGQGNALFLTPIRFDPDAALKRVVTKDNVNVPSVHAVAKEEGVRTNAVDYKGEPIFASTRYVESVGWGIVVKINQSEALAPAQNLRVLLLFIIAIATLLIVYISLAVTNSITKPLQSFTARVNQVAAGDLTQTIAIESKDEIGELSRAFNAMAQNLRQSYEVLESKVKSRTEELSGKLGELEKAKLATLNVLEDLEVSKTNIELEKAKDEAILENMGDGIVVSDANGIVIRTNPAADRLLGFKPQELEGKKFVDAVEMRDKNDNIVPDEKRPIVLAVARSKKTQDSFKYIRKDGKTVSIAVTVTPIFMNEKIIGSVAVFRDITKELEIDKAKTEFVSLASHQLRTPLTAVNWYAEMLLAGDAGKLKPEQAQYIEEMYKGNQRMVQLVNALLNVSRVDLGTFAVDPEPVNVPELCASVLAELRPGIETKQLKVTQTYAPDIPVLPLDPRLTRIIVQNLLTNAVKYTPEKGQIGITVTIDKKNLTITVTDTGCGIPKDQQGKIFTKLFRAENAKAIDNDGNGLGMYLVKAILDETKGSVTFDSVENKGTTFTVTIPASGMKKKDGAKTLDT